MGKIEILLGSTGLHFMKGSADELLLHSKSSTCGFTSMDANVTVQCCWKEWGLCLFPIPWSWLFSSSAQESYPLLHWLWFLLEHFLFQFTTLNQHKTGYFAETDYPKGMNFHLQRWALGSACCGHEAVISVTSLLDLRLTVEAVKLFAALPKDLLAEGRQMMVFRVTETTASWQPRADPSAHLRTRKFSLWEKGRYTKGKRGLFIHLRLNAFLHFSLNWRAMLWVLKAFFPSCDPGERCAKVNTEEPWGSVVELQMILGIYHLRGALRDLQPCSIYSLSSDFGGFKGVEKSNHSMCHRAKIAFFLCVWLWIFIYSVFSFLIPPNYYFSFPFKNSLSKLIWLITVSNTVKVALLECNKFLLWSLAYLDLSGYWFLLRNQSFPLSLSAEGCPGIPFIWMMQGINPNILRACLGSWCEDVLGCWFFSLCGLVRQSLSLWVRSE